MRTALACLRATLFLAGTLLAILVHPAVFLLTRSMGVARLWHRMACAVFGIRVRVHGAPAVGDVPVLFLSNHLSYLDIPVLGAHLDAVFVAKSEVASWPLFGFLARLQNTVFIERRRSALDASRAAITAALEQGNDVILFAEGTSTDGSAVARFKAGLLGIVMPENGAPPAITNVRVQPVAIVLEKVDGQDVSGRQDLRDVYSWWRPETTLAPHLWAFAHHRRTDISLHFLPVLDPGAYADRKALADAARNAVATAVDAANQNGYIRGPDVPVAQLDRALVS